MYYAYSYKQELQIKSHRIIILTNSAAYTQLIYRK